MRACMVRAESVRAPGVLAGCTCPVRDWEVLGSPGCLWCALSVGKPVQADEAPLSTPSLCQVKSWRVKERLLLAINCSVPGTVLSFTQTGTGFGDLEFEVPRRALVKVSVTT